MSPDRKPSHKFSQIVASNGTLAAVTALGMVAYDYLHPTVVAAEPLSGSSHVLSGEMPSQILLQTPPRECVGRVAIEAYRYEDLGGKIGVFDPNIDRELGPLSNSTVII